MSGLSNILPKRFVFVENSPSSPASVLTLRGFSCKKGQKAVTWTPGMERRSASSSAGATWNPFTLISSFSRSVMNQSPSSSYLGQRIVKKKEVLTFRHPRCGSIPQNRQWQQSLPGSRDSQPSHLGLPYTIN